MSEYEQLIKAIDELSLKNFCIKLEDGRTIPFHFKPASFFHLLGLHYLTDMPHISASKNKASLINQLRKDEKLFRQIQASSHYSSVSARIETFPNVVKMLLTDRCEIIVDFDSSLAPKAKICSCFLLYRTDDRNTYHILGIASNGKGLFFPETYFVETSKYYVNGQKLLNCQIFQKPFIFKRGAKRNPEKKESFSA